MQILIDNISTRLNIGGPDLLIDPDLLKHLREYMSVKVPGSYFAVKRLKFHWDGMKYFLTPSGKMATGFLPVILKFIEEEYPDVSVDIIDQRVRLPEFKKEFISDIGNIEMNMVYPHQKHLIEAYNHRIIFRDKVIYFPRGVINAATNAGKTAVLAGVKLNLTTEEDMLIIIHKKTVYQQLLSYFRLVFKEVGQINDRMYDIKPVTIAMIQTLSKRVDSDQTKQDLQRFSILAVDEAHRAGSSMYARTLSYCPAAIRVFVSGTAFDSDDIVNKMIIVGLSGPKLATISKRYLMDNGISTPVQIKMHLCNTILRAPVLEYSDCIRALVHESIERVSIMIKIIRDRVKAGPILIAVEEIKHGEFIYNYISRNCGVSRQGGWDPEFKIDITHSRDQYTMEKIEALNEGEIEVLIATGVLKEGINIPRIATIINAGGKHAKVYVKQWMGRGERKCAGKNILEFHDFYDIGRYVQKDSIKRLKVYRDEELPVDYDFDITNVKRMTSVIIR